MDLQSKEWDSSGRRLSCPQPQSGGVTINNSSTKSDISYFAAAARKTIHFLPKEILYEIISKLPVTSTLQFCFSSKSWTRMPRDPHLVSLHLSRTSQANAPPYLIIHSIYPELSFIQLSHDEPNEPQKVKRFNLPFTAPMPFYGVVGSSNGVLCLYDKLRKRSVKLYNPFTRECKELPEFDEFEAEHTTVIGFGFHPDKMEFKVVRILHYKRVVQPVMKVTLGTRMDITVVRFERIDEGQLFSLRNNSWKSIGEPPYLIDRNTSSVVLNGRWHCFSKPVIYHGRFRDNMIISIDLSDEQFRVVQKPMFGPDPGQFSNYHLTILRNCLGVGYTTPTHMEIWTMEEYDVNESWLKNYSISLSYFPTPLLMPAHYHELQQNEIWSDVTTRALVTVLCMLNNGEILMEYKGSSLILYDPRTNAFKNMSLHGLPNMFKTLVHVGGLGWIG